MMDKLKQNKIVHTIIKVLLVCLGTFVLAFGTSCFQIPFGIISGGISGIGIIIEKATGQDITMWITILTWVLFFIGLLILGPKFSLNTLISTILYPIFVSFFLKTDFGLKIVEALVGFNENVIIGDNLQILNIEVVDTGRILLMGILSGGIIGTGCGITFLGGGSTGGLDILTFILSKFTGFKESIYFFLLDGTIVFSGLIYNLLHNNPTLFLSGLVGIISAYICSSAVDRIYVSSQSGLVCDIVTEKQQEIVDFIREQLDRTSTILKVKGAYSDNEKTMIRVVITKNQYIKIKDALSIIDPYAFVTFSPCNLVTGEGFQKNKSSNDTLIVTVINKIKEKIKKNKKDERE